MPRQDEQISDTARHPRGTLRVALPPAVSPAALARRDPAARVETLAGEALGTGWRIRLVGRDAPLADLREAIGRRLQDVVGEMSQWEPGSVLSRFNRTPAAAWTALPPDFATVIAAALAIAAASDGAFDPTHGRAAALLGFGALAATGSPSPAALDEAFVDAGWRRLAFDPAARRLRQPGGMWLDLAGIAKGFAVDAVADLLGEAGHPDALVEIGGELAGRGLKPDGQPWWVELEAPPGLAAPPLRLALHEAAVATSGDYVRGAHTLDPRTGRPLTNAVAAVSVVHPRAMLADGWATALGVLGAGAGPALADRHGLAARWLIRDGGGGREVLSAALAAMIAD